MKQGDRVYITGACEHRHLRGKIGTVEDISEEYTFLQLDDDPTYMQAYVKHDDVRPLKGQNLVLVKFRNHQTVQMEGGKQVFFNAGEQRVGRYCNTLNTSPMSNVYHDLAWEEGTHPQMHFFLWDGVIAIERDLR